MAGSVVPRQCESCPFRGAGRALRMSCASIPAANWPCHTEHLTHEDARQCRGHWAARRAFAHLHCCGDLEGFAMPIDYLEPIDFYGDA